MPPHEPSMSLLPQPLVLSQPLVGIRLSLEAVSDQAAEEALEQAAYERGRRDGQKEMNDQLMAQRRELIDLQNGVFESLKRAVPQVIRESEHALAALALEAAGKLVAGLPISGEMLEGVIKEALAQVEEATEFHVYLHPDDLHLLRQVDHRLLDLASHPPHLHFHASPECSRGGCLVRTRFGILDARRENKLEILKTAILS